MFVGNRKKRATNNGVLWYRKLMIFTIYAFHDPQRVLVWRMILGLDKQKHFHLLVEFDFELLPLWTSTRFSFHSNESENVEQAKWSLESEKSAFFTILTWQKYTHTQRMRKRLPKENQHSACDEEKGKQWVSDGFSLVCISFSFVEKIHGSSHLEMAYISFAYVANYAPYFMCTIFHCNCSHISFVCFASMSFGTIKQVIVWYKWIISIFLLSADTQYIYIPVYKVTVWLLEYSLCT